MSLDNEDFNRIERSSEGNLPSMSYEFEDYENQNISSSSQERTLDNVEELNNFPEDLPSMSYEFEENQNQNILLSQERTLDNIEEPSNFSEEYNIDQFKESELENFNNFEQESNEKPEVTEFPNEAYADLMELIIKHNLNNKAETQL